MLELVRNLVAHGDAREGKWRGNWRMEWVASTLTPPRNVVYPALLKLMRTPRLPAVDWTEAPTDLNGLLRFGERRNLVSPRVPSRSARAWQSDVLQFLVYFYTRIINLNWRTASVIPQDFNRVLKFFKSRSFSVYLLSKFANMKMTTAYTTVGGTKRRVAGSSLLTLRNTFPRRT